MSLTDSVPENLQEHWRALEDFRLFLDGLELELNRRDSLRHNKGWLNLGFPDGLTVC